MKSYTGKTVEEALEQASKDLGIAVDELIYSVSDKKKGIFNKKLIVDARTNAVCEKITTYLKENGRYQKTIIL